jgi:hypothetical protein
VQYDFPIIEYDASAPQQTQMSGGLLDRTGSSTFCAASLRTQFRQVACQSSFDPARPGCADQ